MTDAIAHFAAAAGGMPVSHVWLGYGSAVCIELGKLTHTTRRNGSPGEAQGEIEMMIESSWRIEEERSVLCGSWSDEELWAPSFARILGQHVVDLATFGASARAHALTFRWPARFFVHDGRRRSGVDSVR